MTGKQVVLGSSVLILVVANIGYWWPNQEIADYSVSPTRTETVSLDDLHALEYLPMEESQVKRDLFLPVTPKKAVQEPPKETKPVASKLEKPAPTRKNNIMPTDHLIRYRLAGVVVKNGERVAYLLDGKTPLIAHAGDSLSQSVTVESIGEQAAILKDLQTGLTRKLMLANE